MTLWLLASSLLGLSASLASASTDGNQKPVSDYAYSCPDYTRYATYIQYAPILPLSDSN